LTAVIATRSLTKTYGKRRGVEDVSFEVRAGEVFGFLGPNGAGKSTTIRSLLGLLRPTSGWAEVLGLDPFREAARVHARIGYLPGEMGLAERLTARDHLSYLASLRGQTLDFEEPAQRLDLDLSRTVRHMSRGNKQKVGLVQAVMSRPELLILDEPTTGLDPLMQQVFHSFVQEARQEGRTVFLSSHIMSEVETLCDRVAIIREGRIVAVEDVPGLKRRAPRHARIRFSRPTPTQALEGVPGVVDLRAEGEHVIVASLQGTTGGLVRRLADLPVEDLELREPSLDDIFLTYYAKREEP
jgi:beta-exotoxin I transport system ATP-binding protein